MKKVLAAALLLVATVAFGKNPVNDNGVKIKDSDENGVPTFVTGPLGKLNGSPDKAAKEFLKAQKALLKMAGTEDFDVVSTKKDSLGFTHIKMAQKLRGLPVIGAEYIVHADASGNIYAMNGRFAPDNDLPRHPTVDSVGALNRAAAQRGVIVARYTDSPSLVYVVNEKGRAFLAWRSTLSYSNAEGEQLDVIFADATSGDLVAFAPKIHRARNRATYNVNNGTSLPGTLAMSETSAPSSDVSIAKAHEYAGVTYDYYSAIHARDSYNGAGAQLKSSVHYSSSYNNAFWNGSQMVYGDGDGSQFGPFSRALDVVAHELSHAVTEYEANLVYSYESGALNEATSDIFGVAAEAWQYGVIDARTWKVGEDCYTPATAGDALRYMNSPTLDGYSKDYYPERLTGSGDNGGVHGNSGIANLAVYMMTMGGTHPRGKTTINVTPLSTTPTTSLNMAAKIWYRALANYMTSSTNFSGARTTTVQAATELYGAAAAATVTAAWDAVGAPGGGGGGGTTVTLTNGVAVTGNSGSTGSWKHFKITVPASQSQLKIEQSLGTGDADLYVKRGAQPTLTVYDYRPYLGGNTETVTVANPVAGDWFISIYAYATYSGVSIKATYTGTVPPPACTSVSGTLSGTGANFYTPSTSGYVSSISGAHTGKLTGPAGTDFDLYLQKLSGSTWTSVAAGETATSIENITYNGTSGTYRWRVYAYSGSGSFTLCTTKP
jgi:vibriolysin